MPPPVIRAEALDKAYGGRHLFEDATFQIESGDHVAIVGANGAGKSTLLRILAGRDRPDHGSLDLAPDVRTHWFDQHPTYEPDARVRDVLAAPLPPPAHLQTELEDLEQRIADPQLYETEGFHAVLERYAEVQKAVLV